MLEKKPLLLYSMTGHPVFIINGFKFLLHGFAFLHCHLASGVERAATGWIDRAGDIAFENDSFTSAVYLGIRDGNRREEGDGIGVFGVLVEIIAGCDLNDFSKVHHCNPVTDVSHHGKVMRDEKVGQVQFFSQFHKQFDDLTLNRYIKCGNRLITDNEGRTC
jgi:hypothetical protein|tara:strand:+ start:87 stop:572 length:486 start_codon:yes stop_codon:yes gene_type:complete